MFDFFRKVLGLGAKTLDNMTGAGKESREQHATINEAEISGAPTSSLRLWRSALGWGLALSFMWEVMIRPVICTYWPEATLPPSFMKETMSLLLGMLGLGF